MSDQPIQIRRYSNRRYYARNTSKYVSLTEIEQMIQDGETVEIHDSQANDDITRAVLTQIILERHPDKMSLFPTDMLHFILRSNDAMSDFLRDYFRHSVTYLDYLQRNSTTAALARPMHWVKAWLDAIKPQEFEEGADINEPRDKEAVVSASDGGVELDRADLLAQRVEQLERRMKELEVVEREEKLRQNDSSNE